MKETLRGKRQKDGRRDLMRDRLAEETEGQRCRRKKTHKRKEHTKDRYKGKKPKDEVRKQVLGIL